MRTVNLPPPTTGEIATHAVKLADAALNAADFPGYDRAGAAASAVISVALTQAVGPLDSAYVPLLKMTGHFMRGYLAGTDHAKWALTHFEHYHDPKFQRVHLAQVRAIADVIEATGLTCGGLSAALAELRAYADALDPNPTTPGRGN